MAAAEDGSFCQVRSASANEPASGKRSAGSRCRARMTIADRPLGTGTNDSGGGGSSFRRLSATPAAESASNGRRPLSIS